MQGQVSATLRPYVMLVSPQLARYFLARMLDPITRSALSWSGSASWHNEGRGNTMKKTNAINEAFACVIVCALAFGLTFITAAGWLL
jgi:hypothetical protein